MDAKKTPGSWMWIKDTRGHESVSVTFVTVAFWITVLAYVASIFQSIGPLTFRPFDSTACLTFLGPLLALYFGRKMTDAKLPVPGTLPQPAVLPILTDAPAQSDPPPASGDPTSK